MKVLTIKKKKQKSDYMERYKEWEKEKKAKSNDKIDKSDPII